MNLLKRSQQASVAALVGLFSFNCEAQVFWTEDFEVDGDGTTYFTDPGDVFIDSSNDYYTRTDGSGTTGGYSNANGSFYWAGEDLDDAGTGNGVNPKTLTFASQTITGMTAVRFLGLFGQGTAGASGVDVADFMRVEYSIDAGTWTPLIQFHGINNGDATNNGAALDSDMNGVGDAPLLTDAFAEFTVDVAVSGTSIQLRIIMSANSGSEELGFDYFRLEDISGAPSCGIGVLAETSTCDSISADSDDTYNLSIPYTGVDAGTTVINNSGSGTVSGDDPAMVSNGTILIEGISELDDYDITFSAPCDAINITGTAPDCDPAVVLDLVINEVHADPDATNGDANGDGSVDTQQDEFVEIVNNGATDADISGFTLSDAVAVRHTFPGATIIPAGCAIVVFGGGTPTGAFGGAIVTVASSGQLGLNNGGDDVTVADASSAPVAQVLGYSGGGSNQSITRDPDVTGGAFVQHSVATGSGGALYSPGTRIDGTTFSGCTPPACGVSFLSESVDCESNTAGTTDTYSVSIPYNGLQAGVTVLNNSASGSISALSDDPATTNGGTIIIEGIAETDAYDITLSAPCAANAVSGPAPTCDPIILPTLVINEIDYDQPGVDDAEFVEIKNVGPNPVDLTGIELLIINGSGTGSISNTIGLNSVSLAAGDYYVICQDGGTTANCDQVESGMSIQNGAPDGVALRDGSGNLIDVVSYEGDIDPPYTEGSGVGLEDSGASGNELSGISRFPDGVDTDVNNSDFTTRCITPGMANTPQNSFCLCEPATASVSTSCPDDFNFNITVDVTALGSSGTVDISDNVGGSQTGLGIGMYTFGPYPNNTLVDILIAHDSEPSCDVSITSITTDCTPAGPCTDNEVMLEITTDDFPNEIIWDIYPFGSGTPVCSGGPYFANFSQFTETCCLPDGDYNLFFSDAFGDGINPGGGFDLKDSAGERIIGAEGVVIPGGTAFNYGQSFSVPIGSVKLYHYFCGKRDYLLNDFIVSQLDPMVSAEYGVGDNTDDGYQFWFFDVYSGYSRRIFRSHANPSQGTAPGPGAAAHVRFSNMVTLPIPLNTLLNCRIRPRVNGVNGAFGPSCFVEVNPSNATCPITQLIDDPANQFFSCGVTRVFGGSDKIHAQPVQGVNRYRFLFEIPSEGFTRYIAVPTYVLKLRWLTLPLQAGKTYDVSVATSTDNGATYCPLGASCSVTISSSILLSPVSQRNIEQTTEVTSLTLWPNPSLTGEVNIMVQDLPESVGFAQITVLDAFGKYVQETNTSVVDGKINTRLHLDRNLAPGLYFIQLRAGSTIRTERLIVK